MSRPIAKLLGLLMRAEAPPGNAFDGFVDSLLQKFENCRGGLRDEWLAGSPEAAAFFLELYEPEIPRLREAIRLEEPLLDAAAHDEIFRRVDALMRTVLIPSYLRIALPFTRGERNAFYLLPENGHAVERVLWALLGLAVGGFVVWAPFIPIWSKDLILPAGILGFFVPNLRKLWRLRRYEHELNQMVTRAERELLRVDGSYLGRTSALEPGVRAAEPAAATPETREDDSGGIPPEETTSETIRRLAAQRETRRQNEGHEGS